MNGNYNQSTVSGEKWTRAKEVHFKNPLGRDPSVIFMEEDAVLLGTDEATIQTNKKIHAVMSQAVLGETFNLVNPVDGTVTGSATYGEVYAMIYSLYLHLADKRDNPPPSTP